MFDEAQQQMADALEQNNGALTVAEMTNACDTTDLVMEQAVKETAETVDEDGDTWVVSVDAIEQTYDVPSDDDGTDSADANEAPEAPQQADGTAADQNPTEMSAGPQEATESGSVDLTTERKEFYEVNGIHVDVNPQQALAGEPTGDTILGARVLQNSHPEVPDTTIPYYPVNLGERDSEEVFFRALALHIPAILEGEAGTGKNQLVASAASRLNLPMYRQEFGNDTSVMDVVGEKDLDGDGGTFYILGKAARAAMFGGVYVADEINMATGSVTSYLHPLFEDRGSRELELRGTGRTLHDLPEGVEWDPSKHLGKFIHPDFVAVGTCNPLDYADTNPMNDALRSRCMVIRHPYLAESPTDTDGVKQEANLAADETGADADDVKGVVELAALLRQARREGNDIQTPIGHREIRDTVELAGPNEEFMSYKAAAHIKFEGQAALKSDKQYIADAIEEEL